MSKLHLALLLMIITWTSALDLDLCTRPNGYAQFLKACNKEYQPNQMAERKTIFQTACTNIQVLISKGTSFQVGITCNSDLDPREMVNSIKPPNAKTGILPTEPIKNLVNSVGLSVGSSVYTNWQHNGMLTSVKNQGSCGCCWTFSTTSCYESAFKRIKKIDLDLSEQWVLQCTDVFKTTNSLKSTCQGGVVDYTFPMLVANGIPAQSTYPYAAKTFTGVGKPSTISNCFAANTNFNILRYNNNSLAQWFRFDNATPSQIQSLLVSGTLVVLYYADSGFLSYKSGVYSCSVNSTQAFGLINHAMELVGMDANGNYIVKNSWGTSWGMSGFATINQAASCGLNGFVYQLLFDYYYSFGLALFSILIVLISA